MRTYHQMLRIARLPVNSLARTKQRALSTAVSARQERQFPFQSILTNWRTLDVQPMSGRSLEGLFANEIPCLAVPKFLSADECDRIVDVIQTHKIGSYNDDVYPPIGSVGITQFDHRLDKVGYFKKVTEARSLQKRLATEARVDILDRVARLLCAASGLPVRVAKEGEQEYFAGLLRLVNSSALIHADYGPFDGPSWEIGRIAAQITWNILLKPVQGGEAIIYDRMWEGAADDKRFKKPAPSYGYSPSMVEGRAFKVLKNQPGDLTFFNSRNFHEVKSLDNPNKETRYTLSSFVGFLPATSSAGPTIILWS